MGKNKRIEELEKKASELYVEDIPISEMVHSTLSGVECKEYDKLIKK